MSGAREYARGYNREPGRNPSGAAQQDAKPEPGASVLRTAVRHRVGASSARLAPKGENGGDELIGALLGQKVPAAFDRAALHAVAERRHRRAERVANAVSSAERQHGHRQPLSGA